MTAVPADLTKTGGKIPPVQPISPTPPSPHPAETAAALQQEGLDRAAAAAKSATGHPKDCPHCGLSPAVPPVEVTPADQVEFAAAVFAGLPFAREYVLFGGAVRVKFRTLDLDESDAVQGVMDRLEAAKTFPADLAGAAARFEVGVGHYSAVAVERLILGGVTHTRPANLSPENARNWLRKLVKQEPVYAAVREAYLKFAGLAGAVQRKAFDPSFSSATAASGNSPASPPPASRS